MVNKLMEILTARLGGKKGAISALEELIDRSNSTIYRKLKGESGLSVDNLQNILDTYGLGWTFYEGDADQTTLLTHIEPASLKEEDLMDYMKRVWEELVAPVQADQAEVTVFARDIPLVHYVCMPNLFCFALYDWAHAQGYPDMGSFDDFAHRYSGMCRRIASGCGCSWYNERPSIEFWNEQTLSSLFMAITFHVRCNMLSTESLRRIETDLLGIVAKLQKWVKDGRKDEAGAVSFELYSTGATLDTTVMNYWYGGRMRHLKTLNAGQHMKLDMIIKDKQIMQARIDGIYSRSSNLCAMSEVDKVDFFCKLQKQITDFFMGLRSNSV